MRPLSLALAAVVLCGLVIGLQQRTVAQLWCCTFKATAPTPTPFPTTSPASPSPGPVITSPSPFPVFTGFGQAQTLTASESNYFGTLAVSGCQTPAPIVTIFPASAPGPTPPAFSITALSNGSCTLTISGGLSTTVAVNVQTPVPVTPTPSPTATPVPPTPTPAPTPTPTPTPFSNQFVYHGCGVFPANDTFNYPVTGYSPTANSAATIAQLPSGTFDQGDVQKAYQVNLVTNASATFTPQTVAGGHNPPFYNTTHVPVPTPSPFIEPLSDAHFASLNTDSCQDYEAYGAKWTAPSGPFAAYSGQTNNLNATWASQAVANHDAVTASGLQYIGLTWWGEEAADSVINHMGSFAMKTGQCYSQYGYVYPATSPSFVADSLNCAHPIHNGTIARLKATFDCTGGGTIDTLGQRICQALKTYGAVLRDQAGGYTLTFGLTTGGVEGWNYGTDLRPLMRLLNMSQFDLIELGPIQCLTGHSGCK